MSDLDLTMKNYMKDPNVFADVFNYALYQGKQVIKPEALQELDPEEIIFINGRKGKKTRLAKGSRRSQRRYFKHTVNKCESTYAQHAYHFKRRNGSFGSQ